MSGVPPRISDNVAANSDTNIETESITAEANVDLDDDTDNNHMRETQEFDEKTLPEPPFTIFNHHEKFLLIVILSAVGFCSTTSSPIYFPALPTLTRYFKTTESVINLSVVAYLLAQGIAPTFVCNVADVIGIRPMMILSVLVYVAACVAISQTNVYWLLAVLRCLQAAGIGPVIAMSSGVSGHVCTPKERGGFVGVVSGVQLVGNGLGGLIGAALVSGFHTWRAIFVFLAILGGVVLVSTIVILPETSRSIVGNGSILPPSMVHRSLLFALPHFKKKLTGDYSTLEIKNKFDILSPFKILVKPQVFCILLPAGIHFAAWTMVLTSLSTTLEAPPYSYGVMHVGLIYLPQGLVCLLSSLVTGRCLNYYYRYRYGQYLEKYKDVEESTRPAFNSVRTRIDLCCIPATLMIIGLLIFGWCFKYHKAAISIIISSCLVSFSASSFMTCCTTTLVDMYPTKGNSSTSCLNLVRCTLAALGAGVLDKLVAAINIGCCYTLVAGLSLAADLLVFYIVYDQKKQANKATS